MNVFDALKEGWAGGKRSRPSSAGVGGHSQRAGPPDCRRASVPALEPLEPRLLLSADLPGTLYGMVGADASDAGDSAGQATGFRSGEVLVAFQPGTGDSRAEEARQALGAEEIREFTRIGVHHWRLPQGLGVPQAVEALSRNPNVRYAEPNYALSVTTMPSDPMFVDLWGLDNTGQTGGTPDADIDAPEAWGISTGSTDIVVGVIDTGVDYNHEDLIGNIWINPGEIADNGVDDDGNGYIDDIRGWDWANGDNDPMDDNGHGTHCSGTIGAVGNNDTGVVGVNWDVKIMALKFADAGGVGWTDDAVEALDYATMMRNNGVNIVLTSNSWGGGGFSQALQDAIYANGQADMLFIAAAGNGSTDTDVNPHYPASYDLDNIISVASTDHNDAKASSSNWGATSVDLGAPGVDILSSLPGDGYGPMSGASMAAPYVAGAAALAWSLAPAAGYADIRNAIFEGVDPNDALRTDGLTPTVTGGRLNASGTLKKLGVAAIAVNPAAGLITTERGATDTFTIVLSTEPTADVTIGLSSSDTGEGTVSPTNVTFTPANWNQPQTVTVTGQDDADHDGDALYAIITAPAVSADSAYNGLDAGDVDCVNLDEDTAPDPSLQVGSTESDAAGWRTVAFGRTYSSMVVVCTASYTSSGPPAVVRVRNASGNSFEFRVDQADGTNTPLGGVTVQYLVVEEGVYGEALHGVKMEAAKLASTVTDYYSSDNESSWVGQIRSYSNRYSQPVVLGQVMTSNDADFSQFWCRGPGRGCPPTDSTLYVGKHVGEDPDLTRADETVGYVVIEAGSGTLGGRSYVAALGEDTIWGMDNSPPFSYPLSGLSSPSVAIACQGGMDGGNGGWAVLYGADAVSATSLKLAIDEDQVNDSERDHTSEQVAYIVFSDPLTETYHSTDTPLAIADAHPKKGPKTTTSELEISSSATIGSLEIDISINHVDMSELTISLTSPSGTEAQLEYVGTEWVLVDPNAFAGEPVNGIWILAVTDGLRGNTGTLLEWSLTVSPLGAPPVAADDAYAIDEDNTLTVPAPGVLANDTDEQGDPLTAALVSGVSNGTLGLNPDGSFTYTPQADFHGTDSFVYRASDGAADSDPATVTIVVDPVNDAPVANDDAAMTDEATPVVIDVLANDADVDGDALSVGSVTQGTDGVVSHDGTDITYVPSAGFTGVDTFTYTVGDGQGGTDTAVVTVTVSPALPIPGDANEDGSVDGADYTIWADHFGDQPVPSWSQGGWAFGNFNEDDSVDGGDYTIWADNYEQPGNWGDGDFTGDGYVDGADYTAWADNYEGSGGQACGVDEDGVLVVAAAGGVLDNDSDAEGDPLTAVLVSDVSHGVLVLNADGSFTYTPDAGFSGADGFTYEAHDGQASSGLATVSISVHPVTETYHSTDTPLAIADAHPKKGPRTTTSELEISSGTTIGLLDIDISIDHADMSELTISLTSPAGTEAQLEYVGTEWVLVDPTAFAGEPVDGIWILAVTDSLKRNTGTLLEWSLTVSPLP